jgi:hypothetical protein
MILQAYIVTILLAALVLINVIAKLFFAEFPANKEAPAPFFSSWLRFPKMKEHVEERARGFLLFMYHLQWITAVLLFGVLVFGNYTM